jgi:hypothetical protein
MNKRRPSIETAHEFFELLGRAIVAWSYVDDELFRIFSECLYQGASEQAAIIFYRTPTLDARIKLTDEIVRSILPGRARRSGGHDHLSVKQWRSLLNEIEALLVIRRSLAHHPVSYTYERVLAETDTIDRPTLRLELKAGEYERLRTTSSKQSPVRREDILTHLTSVRQKAKDLNDFSRDVLSRLLEERAR